MRPAWTAGLLAFVTTSVGCMAATVSHHENAFPEHKRAGIGWGLGEAARDYTDAWSGNGIPGKARHLVRSECGAEARLRPADVHGSRRQQRLERKRRRLIGLGGGVANVSYGQEGRGTLGKERTALLAFGVSAGGTLGQLVLGGTAIMLGSGDIDNAAGDTDHGMALIIGPSAERTMGIGSAAFVVHAIYQ